MHDAYRPVHTMRAANIGRSPGISSRARECAGIFERHSGLFASKKLFNIPPSVDIRNYKFFFF